MAQRLSSSNSSGSNQQQASKGNNTQPLVYNHHKMLKEIRDNLKHLRREPENLSGCDLGPEPPQQQQQQQVGSSQIITSTNTGAQIHYVGCNNTSPSKSVHNSNQTTAVLNTQRVQQQPRVLNTPQRNNYIEARRVQDSHQIPQAGLNRVYDESGYSSSSSECSSLSANEIQNSGSQFNVGNMPYYEEPLHHQGLLSTSNFDFVQAMANNDGYQRITPATSQKRRNVTTNSMFPAKSPPSYQAATQMKPPSFTGSSEHLPMHTNHTSKVETKYMQKTALPSGNTTISQAEWKVTTGPDIPRGRSPVPYNRAGIPEGGARWKTRPYPVGQKPFPPPPNQGAFNHNNINPPYPQSSQPQPTPQFQVQVSLNAQNLAPTGNPVVQKAPAPSATFRVSVQTSPVSQDNAQYPTMQQQSMGSGYPSMQPELTAARDYRSGREGHGGYHQPMTSHPPSSGHLVQSTFTSHNPPQRQLTQPATHPPPYSYPGQHPPDSSQNSSFSSSYQSTDSEMMRSNPPAQQQSYNDLKALQQWSAPRRPAVDTMSVSSSGSENSTIEEESFPEFDEVSVTSHDESEDGGVVMNKTGTLVFHLRNRPTFEVATNSDRDSSDGAKPENSRATNHRLTTPEAYKFYMEQRVENVLKARQEREQRRVQLEEEMKKIQLSEEAQTKMRDILKQKESKYLRLTRAKMHPSMFKQLQVIGVGAFGEVCLTRHVQSGSLYAMKILKKAEVLKRNQVAHVKAERDILAEADNEWVVKLFYSFQDKDHLYFVMEYVPGGDLMSLLIKYGVFSENMARFYIAELVLAIDSVHNMGFIHRDIKPDNVLIDSDGHIKLTDFGLCTGFRWTHDSKYYQNGTLPRNHSPAPSFDLNDGSTSFVNKERHCKCRCGHTVDKKKPLARRHIRQHMRCQAHSLVGTPNYIAPEVLMRVPYTHLCDWWSVGVILYEMLVGQPPFYAPNAAETQMKVINWETTLQIPSQAKLSTEAEDLILRLCSSANERLGLTGVDSIKNHPFFHGIDWVMIRRTEAYYIPHIGHPEDTSNFDPIEPERPQSQDCEVSMTDVDEDAKTKSKHPSHAFYEFTFRRFFTKDPARSSVSNYSSWDDTESDENKAPVFV